LYDKTRYGSFFSTSSFNRIGPRSVIMVDSPPIHPPPVWWTNAAAFTVSNIPVSESSTGKTKHADNCPSFRPALINVGVFGKNFNSDKYFSYLAAILSLFSTSGDPSATAMEILLKKPEASSTTSPFSFLAKYRFSKTFSAFSDSFSEDMFFSKIYVL